MGDASVIKIGIMGAPCTGKTTLAKGLSVELQYRWRRLAEYIDEYARQFVARFGTPTVYDQYFFFEQQLKKEQQVSAKTEFLITDSPCYLSYIYGSKVMDSRSGKDRLYFLALVERLAEHLHRYDYTFYLPVTGNPVEEDGMRIHTTEDMRRDIDRRIQGFFAIYSVPYHTVDGTLDERLAAIVETLRPELEKRVENLSKEA
jgi:nicotinamide riboside kinase